MGNIVSFAREYFEKDFLQKPFTEVDSLILCNLTYYNFEDSELIERGETGTIQDFLQQHPEEIIKGLVSIDEDRKLRDILRCGGRHGDI